jgi:hypothetical protein
MPIDIKRMKRKEKIVEAPFRGIGSRASPTLVFGLMLSVGAVALIAQPPTTRMSTGIKVY